jgi:hypothetical protein
VFQEAVYLFHVLFVAFLNVKKAVWHSNLIVRRFRNKFNLAYSKQMVLQLQFSSLLEFHGFPFPLHIARSVSGAILSPLYIRLSVSSNSGHQYACIRRQDLSACQEFVNIKSHMELCMFGAWNLSPVLFQKSRRVSHLLGENQIRWRSNELHTTCRPFKNSKRCCRGASLIS